MNIPAENGEPTTTVNQAPGRYGGGPLAEAAQVFALTGFAGAQPLFDLLGRNPTFFVAHRAEPLAIIGVVALALVVPALLITVVVRLAGLVSPMAGRWAQQIAIGGLLALVLIPWLTRTYEPRLRYALAAFIAVAVIGMLLYSRTRWFPSLLTWAALAPPVFALWLLIATPVSSLVFADKVDLQDLEVTSETDVVMLVMDEFALNGILGAEGEINEERYPNFARLADLATWYPRATTVHSSTRIAVTSILTGILPPSNAVPVAQNHPYNLFTLLGSSHDMIAREAITALCPTDACEELAGPDDPSAPSLHVDALIAYLHVVLPPQLAERWLPPIGDRWAGFSDASIDSDPFAVVQERQEDHWFDTWLNRMDADRPPSLYYLHTLIPHMPWRFLPSGQIYQNDFFGGVFYDNLGGTWRRGPEYTDQGVQRFLLQVGYADLLIGRLLDKLSSEGMLEDALLIVLADHGIAFVGDASRRSLEEGKNEAGILPIPMFVKLPGQEAGAMDVRATQTIDVLPTVIDVLGIGVDWDLDGHSLLGDDPTGPVMVTPDGVEALPSDLYEDAIEIAARNELVFGDGTEPYDLYAFGPHRQLVGGPIPSEIGETLDGGIVATISDAGSFLDVDPAANAVTSRVTGIIDSLGSPVDLALTLEDKVVGVGRSYYFPDQDAWWFSIFVPPELLARGCNDIGMAALSEAGWARVAIGNDWDC